MDLSKTLQELERDDWGDPHGPTEMVKRCLRLRRVPLNQLSLDDCRLLLGQHIGAVFLVPLALRFLEGNPMASDGMTPGALLQNVLRQPKEFWQLHPDLWHDVNSLVIEVGFVRAAIEDMTPNIQSFEQAFSS